MTEGKKLKKAFLCRAIPAEADSRVRRFHEILETNSYEVKLIQWGGRNSENTICAPIMRIRGNPFINILMTPIFSIWLFIFFLRRANENDLVVAVDLDTGLSAMLGSFLKGYHYIYDIADPFSVCRLNRNIAAINSIESKVAKNALVATIPSKCRSAFYKTPLDFLVIENVPTSRKNQILESNNDFIEKDRLIIGYFGTMEATHRCLEILVAAVLSIENVCLIIGGRGAMENFFREKVKAHPEKIKFLGAYLPEDLSNISKSCDLLYACYSSAKIHHKYVAANKLYEHLMLGLPVITNSGTNFAVDIQKWNSGWVIEESYESLRDLLIELKDNQLGIKAKAITAKNLWHTKYSHYWTQDDTVKKFIKVIRGQ